MRRKKFSEDEDDGVNKLPSAMIQWAVSIFLCTLNWRPTLTVMMISENHEKIGNHYDNDNKKTRCERG